MIIRRSARRAGTYTKVASVQKPAAGNISPARRVASCDGVMAAPRKNFLRLAPYRAAEDPLDASKLAQPEHVTCSIVGIDLHRVIQHDPF
jgi:hypothetical protein